MAIGVPMIDLRRLLRAETGQSVNPAQGVQAQAAQDVKINRQQRELWDAYNWKHLNYYVDVDAPTGQRLYSYPEEMAYDQITALYWAAGGENWKRLEYGIHVTATPPGGYPSIEGTPGFWANRAEVTGGVTNPTGMLEIHPVPAMQGVLRFAGQAPLKEMVLDTDTCIIDSDAIVLFAAAEVLATQKQEVAQLMLQKAQRHLLRLLSNNGAEKRRNYNMGGNMRASAQSRPVAYIDYIP